MAQVYERTCIEFWSITAQNGDHFETVPGKDYTTSTDWEDGSCTVFTGFWVRVPARCFTGKRRLGQKLGDAKAGDAEYASWFAPTYQPHCP
jgi:hypothetical protein